jgi:hypothetical protein
MECSVTWYNRVATTQQARVTTMWCSSTLPFLTCSQVPLHIMSSDSSGIFSSCSVVNTAVYPAPFPGSFWDAMRCRPCLVFPFVRPLFSFSSFCFLFLFRFTLNPGDCSLSLTGHGDLLPPANARGSEAATTSQSPVPPLKPRSRHRRRRIPLVTSPRHARRSHHPPVHCPIMGFGLVSELSTSFPTSR